MIRKYIFTMPVVLLYFLLFSIKAFAASSDIAILVTSPIDSLHNESGVVAVEHFPAEISIGVVAQTGTLMDIQLEYAGQSRTISSEYTLIVESKEACGPYTITAQTDQRAILTITVNVVYQVKATYDTRYRTTSMLITDIYEGDTLLTSFPEPRQISLVNANTVAAHEQERIAEWIGRHDGKTYTLQGSLVVEIYGFTSGKVYRTYDTKTDFESLTTRYGWTKKALVAFETMRNTALSYQAPVRISVNAMWCDESKQTVYGRITAQEKGVPELLYPYQTTSISFHKDDIRFSRNFQYMGLEWDYTPETKEFTDGESPTQVEITQKIHHQIPVADFYFKFRAQDGNDLSVIIRSPSTVFRGADYSFSIIYGNRGTSAAYDVSLEGTIDGIVIEEIPSIQDLSPNQSKTYTVKRTADTAADEILLWAHIGVPEGFVDGNLANNTATAVIRVIDPAPETTPGDTDMPPDDLDIPDDPGNPPEEPPVEKELCDLSVSILAAPTVYEYMDYSLTINFTNLSDLEIKATPLQGKINESMLSQIPKTADFKRQETKSFSITGTAGSAGEIYQLWANIGVPEGYTDNNPINNTAVSSITVVEKPDNPDPDKPTDDPDDPNNPDDPEEPGNPPENPAKLLCDVWVNLSSPPLVYEQEEFSFTVYFANSTDKALSGVSLDVAINGKKVSSIPVTDNFQAFEKKSFVITSKAGVKGESLRLSAQVSAPEGYTDTSPDNNQAFADIFVLARPYDLDVQRISPDQYKENQSVITTIKVSNKGSQDFTPGENVTVLFQIPELSFSKRMDAVVMEKDSWNVVSLRWDTPAVQADMNITLIAVINPEGALNNESTTDNNTYIQSAVIRDVAYEKPDESRALPDPPKRNEQPRVTWWEQRYEHGQFVWRQFYAELKVTATLDYDTKVKSYLKSGYGYSIRVTATVNTNYDRPELITVPQTAEVYLPEYRYETALPLIKEGGQFIFQENPASPFRYKKQYIPIWFPDFQDYIVQLLVTDAHTPGGTLSRWITGGELKIFVVDNMYDDDVTTGN